MPPPALIARVAFGGQIAAHKIGLRHPLIRQNHPAFGKLRRLRRAVARLDLVRRRQRSVMRLCHRQHLLRVNITRHHQNRVIRRVIGVIKRQSIVAA